MPANFDNIQKLCSFVALFPPLLAAERAEVAILISDKIHFKSIKFRGDKEGRWILIKG